MSADGGSLTRATYSPGLEEGGFFSRDGQQIALVSERTYNPDIWVLSAAGSNKRQVATDLGRDQYLMFNKDGMRIMFCSASSGIEDIYTSNTDGTNVQTLPYQTQGYLKPYWGPSGNAVSLGPFENFFCNICSTDWNNGWSYARLTQYQGNNLHPVFNHRDADCVPERP
jgi:hypothetical protein